ncbi:MAG: hypothetical protein ACRDPR_23620, partial [Nocardioidaceae bacterium]
MTPADFASFSNNAIASASVVYALALLSHLAEWAAGRSVPADSQRAAQPVSQPVSQPVPQPVSQPVSLGERVPVSAGRASGAADAGPSYDERG